MDMSRLHVGHGDIAHFADEHVNLKREHVREYREQAGRLRERLEAHIAEHPEFSLRKILISGSLAKGTALKSIDDIDMALYITNADAPTEMTTLIPWLVERLRKAFPSFKPEQIVANPTTITVLYAGSGLKVDIVPILYDGDPQWKGHMVATSTGDKILTSIPMHLDFVRRRKDANKVHFAQIVRLLKYWVKQQKAQNKNFRFKSFMVELVVAHLADSGLVLDDYPEALAKIFAHIAKDNFVTSIVFADHYHPSTPNASSHPIRIWDPVNPENNVAKRYDDAQRNAIIDAALAAGDAVDSALHATTKSDTLRYWQKVFGPAFDA
jgi:tRNA nucleotidyltransferase (CCA-adding enzyme)